MINENKLNYLRILNKQFREGKIKKKRYKKEIKWIRKNIS